MKKMSACSSKIFLVVFLFYVSFSLRLVQCASVNPVTNCTLFKNVMAATRAITDYSGWLYNFKSELENPYNTQYTIATNLFDGLKLTAAAGLYSRLLNNIQNDDSLRNYSGFNNTNIPGFFSSMLSYVIRDMCHWLLSYGDAITLRQNVNCSHPAEQIMLSQFSMVIPIISDFQAFEDKFPCSVNGSYSDTWVKRNLLNEFKPEINYLRGLVAQELYN